MRPGLIALACAAALWAAPALADDAADCQAGIDTIKAELAKNPAADVKTKLEKLLGDAEREAGEQEWDECFDAVNDAKEITGG